MTDPEFNAYLLRRVRKQIITTCADEPPVSVTLDEQHGVTLGFDEGSCTLANVRHVQQLHLMLSEVLAELERRYT